MKISSKIRECRSYSIIKEKAASGKKENNILEPSRGGMGTKLNIPKARLTITIVEVIR